MHVDEQGCLPGTGAIFRFDPNDSSWNEVPLPADLGPSSAGERWTFQPRLVAGADGVVLVATAGAGPAPPLPTHVLALSDRTWQPLATMEAMLVSEACASTDAIWLVTQGLPTGSGDVDLRLARVGKDGGVADVPLPEVDLLYGGAGIEFACDHGGPYLAASAPDLVTPLRLLRWTGAGWDAVEGDWAPGRSTRVESSAAGIVVVNQEINPATSRLYLRQWVPTRPRLARWTRPMPIGISLPTAILRAAS
jgi:hypothetical protein